VQEREVLRELALEARRSIRNLSTVGGLRAGSLFPIDTLRRPFRRNNGKANGNGNGPDDKPAP